MKVIVFVALLVSAGFLAQESTESQSDGILGLSAAEGNNEEMAYAKMESDKDSDTEAYEDYLEVLDIPSPKEEAMVKPSEPAKTEVTPQIDKEMMSEILDKPKGASPVIAKEDINEEKEVLPTVGVVDHKEFGQLLQKHVDKKGNVNYKAFLNDRAKLASYIEKLSKNPVTNKMSKNERLAYYINVYNANTIALILDNYPVSSIQDIAGGKPWDKVFILLGNTSYSLNGIENGIIRKQFPEPRIHFAVNCAAASCPPLLNDAYYPETLLQQLDERTRSFIANNGYNTITSKKLQVSKIFDWYGSDFKDVKLFIQKYVESDLSDTKLEFKEYDWSLNKQ